MALWTKLDGAVEPFDPGLACGIGVASSWRMARGFESKDVEFQQAEADRTRVIRRTLTPAEQQQQEGRRRLELSLSAARGERERASNRAHQQMLDQAIRELEAQLLTLNS